MNFNKNIQRFSDGSELNVAGIAVAVTLGAISATVITAAKLKYDSWTMKRYMKKKFGIKI